MSKEHWRARLQRHRETHEALKKKVDDRLSKHKAEQPEDSVKPAKQKEAP